MQKRGQVTIFIIIAIVVVVAGSMFFVFKDGFSNNKVLTNEEMIFNFVQDCLEKSSNEAFYFIGQHGGYYIPFSQTTLFGAPYYLNGSQMMIPSLEEIEMEISSFIEESLPLCIDNFSSFKNFEIKGKEIFVESNIDSGQVFIDLDYPLMVKKEEELFVLKKFDYSISLNFERLYEASEFIVNSHVENPGQVCLSCILDYQDEKEIKISIESIDNGVVYSLTDPSFQLNLDWGDSSPEDYTLNFGVLF